MEKVLDVKYPRASVPVERTFFGSSDQILAECLLHYSPGTVSVLSPICK
jgi:hypothetical protein